MSILVQVIQAVQAVRDKTWIPKELGNYVFFSDTEDWFYISVSDDRRCEHCEKLNGLEFNGTEIQGRFPDLEIRSPNVIDVNLHLTLWGKDT
jgi:hypothetical protein